MRQQQLVEERSKKTDEVFKKDSSMQLTKVKSVVEKLIEAKEGVQVESDECAVFNLLDWKKENLKEIEKTIEEEFV